MLCVSWLSERKRCSRFTRLWSVFRRETGGNTIAEYGLVAPFLILAVIGAIEVGTVLLTGALMEGAIRDAARYGVTGQDLATRTQKIEEIIGARTAGLVNISVAAISTKIYNSFDVIGLAEPYTDDSPANGEYDEGEIYDDVNNNMVWDTDQGTPGAGDPGEIVLYSVDYEVPLFTGSFLAHLFGHDGKITLTTHVAVQNEPFDDDAV